MIKNDMNLLARYREIHKDKAAHYSPNKMYVVVLLILFLLVGAYSVKLIIDNNMLKSDVQELQAYVESPNVIARMNEVAQLQENIKNLDDMAAEVESINSVFESTVRFDSNTINVLFYNRPTNVEFQNINFQAGSLLVTVSGPRPSDPSNYVLRLQRTGYFKDVSYSGYAYDASNNRYVSTIRLIMKGGN